MTGRWRAPLVLVLVIATLLALQPVDRDALPRPLAPPAVEPHVQIGITTRALAANAAQPWRRSDLEQVTRVERRVGQHLGVVMWFADWEHTRFDAAQARAVAERGSVPEISWEPWDASVGPRRRQPRYRLETIIRGEHDGLVRRWARAIAGYGRPIRLRFAQEMNGRWYPWAERFNGNRPGEFARAWRHVHRLFTQEGATNVTWVWAPVTGRITADQYPGDDAVDVVGLSGFNGGSVLFGRGWRTFPMAFGEALDDVERLFPDKPVELSEVASTEHGGSKAAWIAGMFDELRDRPAVRTLIWFQLRKESDWRLTSSPASVRAFAAGAARLRRLTDATRRSRSPGAAGS